MCAQVPGGDWRAEHGGWVARCQVQSSGWMAGCQVESGGGTGVRWRVMDGWPGGEWWSVGDGWRRYQVQGGGGWSGVSSWMGDGMA